MIKGQILELTFLKDQRVLCDGNTCGVVGAALLPPHWTSGGINKPVSFDPGTTMSVQVKVQVSPINTVFKLFGISKTQPSLNFEFGPLLAGAAPQVVTLRSKVPLPSVIGKLSEYITWNVVPVNGKPEWTNIGQTGVHTMFVTYDTPVLTNSMGMPNAMSVPRLNFIYSSAVRAGDTNFDAAGLASKIHSAVNALMLSGTPNIDYRFPQAADRLWSLADANTPARGHCGEASYLMEQALRMIGVPALQKHVYGRLDRASLDAGKNVVYEDEASHKTVGIENNPQKRTCKQHGEETLRLLFGSRVNAGEGTVEVKGKLYAGLVDDVGEANGGMTAAHDLLLKLQQSQRRFQIWDSVKSGPCKLSAAESGAGDPEPPVPPA